MRRGALGILLMAAALAGCGDGGGSVDGGSAVDGGATLDGGGSVDGGGAVDAGTLDAGAIDAAAPDGGVACGPSADDYTPRTAASATDSWPACISDTATTYPAINPSISTSARVAAFDSLFAPSLGGTPGLLFGPDRDPTMDEFVRGRLLYQTDSGLETRVGRRTDEHVAAPMRPSTCTDPYLCRCLDVAAANPAHCAGPALVQPIVATALNQGIAGGPSEPSRVHAARAEAALLWFLYLSSHKESLSCAGVLPDCDSAWAYYTGGREREDGLGLARLVRALEPETHARIWDSLLAVRCWRDLDDAIPPARVDLQTRARDQQDRAMLRGMVVAITARLRSFQSSTGPAQQAHLAWLRTLLGRIPAHTLTDGTSTFPVAEQPSFFDRSLRVIDPGSADFVAAQIARDPAMIDVDGIAARLDAAYPCP